MPSFGVGTAGRWSSLIPPDERTDVPSYRPPSSCAHHVVGHVLSAGDEVARGHEAPVVRLVGRPRSAERVVVTGRETRWLRGSLGRERVVHLERIEDLRLDVALVRLSGDRLHDEAQNRVVDGAVLVLRANRC